MRLVISEYLRTLKERDELDRLLPDLLVEMGYVPVARPQTGNRQFGVDLAVRGINPDTKCAELLLLVIKQGDVGRSEWDSNEQSVRQSLNEIFDTYLKSHLDAQDVGKSLHIAVVTNGELKQTVQGSWTGYVNDHHQRAAIDFWGLDRLSGLVEKYLLDEHVFRDDDRRDLRRALALAGDAEYDRRDFHRLLLRIFELTCEGGHSGPSTSKALLKSLRIANFSARAFASWATTDGDARQGLKAMERALLWSWHRIQMAEEMTRDKNVAEAFSSLWLGYQYVARRYFEKLQLHSHVEDGLFGYASDGAEFSLVAFEQIGMLASIGLSQILFAVGDTEVRQLNQSNAGTVADAVAGMIQNNGICSSPCLDRHSQDIVLALSLMVFVGRKEDACSWLRKLVRNVDYAYKAKRYVPISSDSIDDLADFGGWHTGNTEDRLMNMSWTLAVLAGWSALLGVDDAYSAIQKGLSDEYPDTCAQLWHPDNQIYKFLYFKPAHFDCGASEAPIRLPPSAADWREHIRVIVKSEQAQIAESSMAAKAGVPALDIIACRHFGTPISPYFRYRLVDMLDQVK
jgi:hypothetical protein